jgi:hypothetical protein
MKGVFIMKINEYLENAKELDSIYKSEDGRLYSEILANHTDIWDNSACIGYLVYACDKVGIDAETQCELIRQMQYAFDMMTVDQASKMY